jgi:hypothetical protein
MRRRLEAAARDGQRRQINVVGRANIQTAVNIGAPGATEVATAEQSANIVQDGSAR